MSSKGLQGAVLGLVLAGTLGGIAWAAARRRSPVERNQRVLILGGSRGLGLLLAEEYLRRKHRVVLAARDERELSDAVVALRGAAEVPDQISGVRCDVEDEADVRRAVDVARERMGGIDVLVNNAGMIQVGPLDTMRLEDFEQAFRVHLRGPLVATLAVLDEMRSRRSGRIVNIASIGGLVPIPHMLPYVASKFALTGFSQGLGVELAKDGVSVTTVCPGLMRTGSNYRATFKGQHTREHTWFALSSATPLSSMGARRAARCIVNAAQSGRAFLILTWQAKLLAALHHMAPGTMLALLSLIDRLLPDSAGSTSHAFEGRDSTSRWVPSRLTALIDRAASELGELGPPKLGPASNGPVSAGDA